MVKTTKQGKGLLLGSSGHRATGGRRAKEGAPNDAGWASWTLVTAGHLALLLTWVHPPQHSPVLSVASSGLLPRLPGILVSANMRRAGTNSSTVPTLLPRAVGRRRVLELKSVLKRPGQGVSQNLRERRPVSQSTRRSPSAPPEVPPSRPGRRRGRSAAGSSGAGPGRSRVGAPQAGVSAGPGRGAGGLAARRVP